MAHHDCPGYAIQLESNRGKFTMLRGDTHQPAAIVRTGKLHIESELSNLLTVVGQLGDGACMLDVGANIGLVAVPCASLLASKGGSVIAFEAQRIVFYMLAANCVANNLLNLHCYHLAVSDSNTVLQIPPMTYTEVRDFGMVQFGSTAELDQSDGSDRTLVGKETVKAIEIDSLELTRVDLMKIDVEGMEMRVLEGAKRTIATHRPILWIEYWLDRDNICTALHQLGYDLWFVDNLNLLCVAREKLEDFRCVVNAPKYQPVAT
ncbi:FkbM family methyltransferase [Paraburkholderia sp. UYCP14C]|uniref:FkbM family methyltransferase n=1 Tax=Paraburkholderia sp. UYCP14C TaxID=2511130 RepID=UPI001459FD3A|nr:FkbM family methyltransferase [Paraburkholderia sp. UYCP14C]